MIKITIAFILSTFFLFSCSSPTNNLDLEEPDSEAIHTPFKEGTIEMGIFSDDLDLGKLIGKIDFSKPDVKQQFDNLLENDQEAKTIFNLIADVGNQNPLAALAMTLNIAECTYHIKNDVVLGNVRGFGWNMDNYHNKSQDIASMYLESLVQTDKIPEQDKEIYTFYKPSENAGINAVNEVDFSQFNRETKNTKQNILGYECNVVVYTPKILNENGPMQLQKLVVYTSSLFSNTINFTHPFYLDENGGILRLDVYYLNNEKPTLVMKPKEIKQKELTIQDLTSRTAAPVYTTDDMNWGFKALAIMMSGWGTLED